MAVRDHGGVPHDLSRRCRWAWAIFLVICYGAYCRTGNPLYLQMFRFWRKIFALGFALGIVAGIVLSFELGLNWGNYAPGRRPDPGADHLPGDTDRLLPRGRFHRRLTEMTGLGARQAPADPAAPQPPTTIIAAIHDRTLDHLPVPADATVRLAAGRVLRVT